MFTLTTKNKKILLGVTVVVGVSICLHIAAIWDNGFYFTMDQGRDAVAARQILGGDLTLLGPATSIEGVYMGPLWYYLIGVGYVAGLGHPVGAVGVMIAITAVIAGLVTYWLVKKESLWVGLLVGIGLVVTRGFFVTSWYAFNPHLLVVSSLGLVLGMLWVSPKRVWPYYLAVCALGLSIHAEVAFFPPLFLVYLAVSGWYLVKKRLSWLDAGLGLGLLTLWFLPHIFYELGSGFEQSRAFFVHVQSENSVFGEVSFVERMGEVGYQLQSLTAESVNGVGYPFLRKVFWAAVGLQMYVAFKKRRWRYAESLSMVTGLLWVVTLVWFATNSGLSPWHLAGLPPLFFLTFCLSWSWLPKKVYIGVLVAIVVAQSVALGVFFDRLDLESDPSILRNQMAAIDWVYSQAGGEPFEVYIYLPSVLDYTYQYLFPWYGARQYGNLPCEYSTYPGTSAGSYVKDSAAFQEKEKDCDKVAKRLLIIEPGEDGGLVQRWHAGVVEGYDEVATSTVGKLQVEYWLDK